MRVWKSPVFYFGVVLVLVVVSALLAPFVVDWNGYRTDLQAFGEKLTGRKVEVAGPVSVRLFPWPKLTAGDVRVANPEGSEDQWFATADQITVSMTLGALLNGVIQVESINIDKPKMKLRRTLKGVGNWNFEPVENIRNNRLLEHVMLDKITITSGSIQMVDDRRGNHADFENLNGTFSAANFTGPWRSAGSFTYNALPLSFTASTGEWVTQEPLRLALRVSSQLSSGYSYAVDGVQGGDKFDGTLRVAPVENEGGKGDTEGQFRPVTLKSKLAANFETIALSDIEIRPADAKDQGTLLAGDANFTIGKVIMAEAKLTAPRVDLDALAGAGSRRLLRDGGGLSLVNGLLTTLPEDIELRSSVKVSALRAGGEILENVLLDVSANRQAVRIHELSASMPGRSRSKFSGVFFPGERFAELAGDLALESLDARQLSWWLWPESKADINKSWTGSRGRLKLQTAVALTASKLDFQNMDYELDGETGKANLAILVNGERPIIDFQVAAETIDIDNFVADGLVALSPTNGEASLPGIMENFVDEQVKRDLRFALEATTLRLNGVETKDVAVELETTVKGFDLKKLEIGFADGARLSASGLFLSTSNGADGTAEIKFTAEDPRPLLRLSGLLPRENDPPWADVLGKTDVKIGLQARPSGVEPATSFNVAGTVGNLKVSSDGNFVSAAEGGGTRINGVTELSSPASSTMFKLFGIPADISDTVPARLMVTADGKFWDAYKVDVDSDVYGSKLHFSGSLSSRETGWGVDGKLAVASEDAKDLLTALKVPTSSAHGGRLSVNAKVDTVANIVTFDEIDAGYADRTFGGTLALEDGRKITGEFTASSASLAGVLAPVFLPWNGRVANLEQTFGKGLPFGLTGELWIRPKTLTIYPGLDVNEAQVGITGDGVESRVTVFAKTAENGKVAVEVAATQASTAHKISGHLVLPIDLSRQLKLNDGTAIASGEVNVNVTFSGEGRSPGAVLAGLRGGGSFALSNGRLLGISPESFSKKVAGVKDARTLNDAFASLRKGNGVAVGAVSGEVKIDGGAATVAPFGASTVDADVLIKPSMELVGGLIEIDVGLDLKASANLPPMEISYAGAPSQLSTREDTTALASFLGFKVLQQGVDDLEKIQAEQQRLAIEEENQRREDQERLEAFYAQRVELRLRMRELRTHANQQVLDAEQAKIEQARLINEGEELNRLELRQRMRELRFFRKLLADATRPAAPVKRKVKPAAPTEFIQVPLILVPPSEP